LSVVEVTSGQMRDSSAMPVISATSPERVRPAQSRIAVASAACSRERKRPAARLCWSR
jgi:hypothetical protein